MIEARPRSSRRRLLLVALLLLGQAGCNAVSIRDTFFDRVAREGRERFAATSLKPTVEWTTAPNVTGAILPSPQDASHREDALAQLEQAEGFYKEGLNWNLIDRDTAIASYRNAAGLASSALESLQGDALSRGIEVHNLALARLLRNAQALAKKRGTNWRAILQEQGISVQGDDGLLEPEIIEDIRVAGDLKVVGMRNVYRNDGFGVPLVAQRVVNPNEPLTSQDYFYPRQLQAAATAVVLPSDADAEGPRTIALIDPFESTRFATGQRELAIASDTTTPLAMQVADGGLSLLEITGLLRADFRRENVAAGLYMLRPYQPGKIPVVLVHGLFSSPRAYLQVINELSNDPEIANRYQLWVFLYPTGQPIPISAARLRENLYKVRGDLDPNHSDPAFDQMVLVGHSMGGLLSKSMALDTGWELWDSAIRRTFDQLVAPHELRQDLRDILVFEPVPFVKRLVFIATPHRGSEIANQFIGRLTTSLIRLPDAQERAIGLLKQLNGPNIISGEMKWHSLTSVGNLKPDSPVLTTLNKVPIRQTIPYHSIIPAIGGQPGQTDGIVPYSSAHLDGAESELVVTGTHSAQQDPAVIAEVRRILVEHMGGPKSVGRNASITSDTN